MTQNDDTVAVPVPPPDEANAAADDSASSKPAKTAATARPQTFTQYDLAMFQDCFDDRDGDRFRAHFGDMTAVVGIFKTDEVRGIEAQSIPARQEQFGVNVMTKKKPVSFLEFVIDALGDRVVQILIVAAIISIIFGMTLEDPHTHEVNRERGWIEGVAITISVLLVVFVGSINNYAKAKQFEELEQEQAIKKMACYRDGKLHTIGSDEIVPGDVFEVITGMEFPCDAVILRAQSLHVNESTITGEIEPVEKSRDGNPFLLGGTMVEAGDGLAMVIAVGDETFQGRLRQEDEDDKDTPLQEKLSDLADKIGYFGFAAAVIIVVALSLKEIILNSTRSGRTWSATTFLNFVLVAVTVVAVAIPEGLPLAVTIALAFAMKAMMNDQCMVRVLESCETMGAANSICSDKTGTLTTNKMTVVQGFAFGREFVFDGCGVKPYNADAAVVGADKQVSNVPAPLQQQLGEAILLNSTAAETEVDGGFVWKGDRTEIAMVTFVRDSLNEDYRAVRGAVPQDRKLSFPFSSERKQMTSVRLNENGTMTVFVKGASEAVLAACTHYVDSDGTRTKLTDAEREMYDAAILSMAKQSSRTIGVARAVVSQQKSLPTEEPLDGFELELLGIIGIQDPIRAEVPDAVAKCRSGHITVRMVTGDNIHTARAIAMNCGIIEDPDVDIALTGTEFRTMVRDDKDRLMDLLPRLRVLARSSPADKHTLVGLLQERGEVVAVTGDGTNDAPALSKADVGFAMVDGTDVAKRKASMVLLDNNFATVVKAVKWGRAVNDNIKKFLQFQLAINIAGVALTLVGSLASDTSKEPFTPVQLLWLNLIMDTLAALSLATELPEDSSLTRLPVYREAPLINYRMGSFILVHGCFQFAMIMALMFKGQTWFKLVQDSDHCDFDVLTVAQRAACEKACTNAGGTYVDDRYCQQGTVHSTMIFNIFIWFQIFNVINARKVNGEMNPLEGIFTRSRDLLFIFGLIAGLQAIAVELTSDFMSVTHLTGNQWGICIGFGALELVLGILHRFLRVPEIVPQEVLDREAKDKAIREQAKQDAIGARSEQAAPF